MDQSLAELLEDAQKVAAHGARAGCFGDDEPLFGALQAALAQDDALTWASPETASLQRALTAAVRAIRPVTLYDLNSGWRVERDAGAGPFRARALTKFGVLALTILVMLACASLTIWQQRATRLVAEFAKNKQDAQQTAFDDLLVLIAGLDDGDGATLLDSDSNVLSAIRRKQREIRALELSMAYDAMLLQDLDRSNALNWTAVAAEEAVHRLAGAIFGSGDDDKIAGLDPGLTVGESGAPVSKPGSECSQAILDKLQLFQTEQSTSGLTDIGYFSRLKDREDSYVQLIRCKIRLYEVQAVGLSGQVLGAQSYDERSLERIRYQLDVLGLWLLPAFYGMLGALIYHLRVYLNNLRPDPSLLKVALRVCLGGFAGVGIGWFWVPQGGAAPTVPELPVTGMALAFLVGFSIDVFLGFLDRLVTLINGWVANLGAPAGS